MKSIFQQNPLLAIMRNVPLEQTLAYAHAIAEAGVGCFEVALNSTHALQQIEMLRKEFGDDLMFGAGTAISVPLAKSALDAGAQFLLTPGTPIEVLAYCQQNQIDLLPGVLTPTDVAVSLSYGFETMKLFPAGDMPSNYIKSLKGPYDQTEYVAIGGVSAQNLGDFIKRGYLAVGLGSNMMPADVLQTNGWKKGTAYVKTLLDTIAQAKQV